MPLWIAEGTAQYATLQTNIGDYKTLKDYVFSVDRRWFSEPSKSFYDESLYCDRCYGGDFYWALAFTPIESVSTSSPPANTSVLLIHRFFEELARRAPKISRYGVREFGPVYKESYLQAAVGLPLNYDPHVFDSWPSAFFTNEYQMTICSVLLGRRRIVWPMGFPTSSIRALPYSETTRTVTQRVDGFSCNYFETALPPPDVDRIAIAWSFRGAPERSQPHVFIGWGGERNPDGSMSFEKSIQSSWGSAKTGRLLPGLIVRLETERTRRNPIIIAIGSGLDKPVAGALAWRYLKKDTP
jgi:hypothetical protein